MKRYSLLLAFLLAGPLMLVGCNATSDAPRFEPVISGILAVAKADLPVLSPADQAIVQPWVTLGTTLDSQLEACITGASAAGGKKAAFLSCFNTFSAGLLNPQELAQLKVISPASQSKVQVWVTAIALGINAALPLFGGNPQPMPVMSSYQPTHQDLSIIARRVNLNPTWGY